MSSNGNRPSERPPAPNASPPGRRARTFEDNEAVRSKVPLMLGLMGPSGSGKTYSALRMATGIQRVSGGDIYVVDTEARRALHYASKFKFRHIQFGAPFSPLDYLDAIEHCVKKGAGVVVVDSMSHEHEGPGGLLEMHEVETQRLAKLWRVSADKAKLSAWSKPKQERRRLINSLLQMPANFVFCFRAKEKLKIVKGKDPEPKGFMPIAGEEFVYEMTMNALLMPNAGGVPTWASKRIGEAMMIKLPEQFRKLMLEERCALSEDIGEKLAIWASGEESVNDPDDYVIPANANRRHGGKNLRMFKDHELEWFVSDAKSPLPPEVKYACKLALENRERLAQSQAQSGAAADDDSVEPDFDPDTGEIHDDDDSDGEPSADDPIDDDNAAPEGDDAQPA